MKTRSKNKVKVSITDLTEKTTDMEGDCVYGCIMERVTGGNGDGTNCRSFLVGGNGIPVIYTSEPMSASILLVMEQLSGGDKELEFALIRDVEETVSKRKLEILSELYEGGSKDGGN